MEPESGVGLGGRDGGACGILGSLNPCGGGESGYVGLSIASCPALSLLGRMPCVGVGVLGRTSRLYRFVSLIMRKFVAS